MSKLYPEFFKQVFGTFGDRYKSLKLRIILLDGLLALVPLIIVVTISYFWFQQILKDDFKRQLQWEIQNSKQSIEIFLEERLAIMRFVASSYTYEQLSEEGALISIFSKLKREFPGLVDMGIIDANGIQKSYVGPYRLRGADYSDQQWFNKIVIRPSFVSDVFMGYRKVPHFAIALKKDIPEEGTFWVMRLTIDIETLQKYVSTINVREKDDVFIINHEGVLQTPSRSHGNVLEKYSDALFIPEESVTIKERDLPESSCSICGYAKIKNSPWVLVSIICSTPYEKIPSIIRNELFIITIFSIIISLVATTLLVQTVVNRIKKADREREEAIAKSEHASKMATIGRLAAGVAHEINNPLAIINEKAGLMKDIMEVNGDLTQKKEKFLGLIDGIFNNVSRCRSITHRLLGFSRRIEVTDAFDLNDCINEVIGFIQNEVIFRHVQLDLDLYKDTLIVKSAKGQLQQVLLNIINNAIDAVEEGGVIKISTRIKNKNTIQVIISDNGMGISKEKLKHIFEPFYTTKEKGKGTGLGLSISYGIIQRLGGTILVESELDKGSTFIVEIPRRHEEDLGGS